MEKNNTILTIVAINILCSLSVASATATFATFSGPPYTPSKCFGENDMGKMIVKVPDPIWNNGELCGKRLTVKCIDASPQNCKPTSVLVLVTDYCSDCDPTEIRLSLDAFEVMAYPHLYHRVKADYELF